MRSTYQPREDALRLVVQWETATVARTVEVAGVLDLGEQGRLLGLEIGGVPGLDLGQAVRSWHEQRGAAGWLSLGDGSAYLQLVAEPVARTTRHVRSVAVRLSLELDAQGRLLAVVLPRRGADYELSSPSGST
jgi:hypothetical protein